MQINEKRLQVEPRLGEDGNPLGIVQEIKI